MNFSVQNAENKSHYIVLNVAGLVKQPIVKQIMRISVVFLVLLFASLQLLLATPGHGQGANETWVTLELKEESLESALRKIERATPFRFVYRNDEIRSIENVTLTKAERTVSETLSLILDKTAFTFREIKQNILILRKAEASAEPDAVSEPVVHEIKGKVTDDAGEGLAGVSIVLKGTTTGTTTDADGAYSLTIPEATGTL